MANSTPYRVPEVQLQPQLQPQAPPLSLQQISSESFLVSFKCAAFLEIAKEALCDLIENFGSPYYTKKSGTGSESIFALNQNYFAALWRLENTAIYERDEAKFYKYVSKTGIWAEISESIIKADMAARILQMSAAFDRFRTDYFLNAVISILRGQLEVRGIFKKRQVAVHCNNGMVVMRDGAPIFY